MYKGRAEPDRASSSGVSTPFTRRRQSWPRNHRVSVERDGLDRFSGLEQGVLDDRSPQAGVAFGAQVHDQRRQAVGFEIIQDFLQPQDQEGLRIGRVKVDFAFGSRIGGEHGTRQTKHSRSRLAAQVGEVPAPYLERPVGCVFDLLIPGRDHTFSIRQGIRCSSRL